MTSVLTGINLAEKKRSKGEMNTVASSTRVVTEPETSRNPVAEERGAQLKCLPTKTPNSKLTIFVLSET